MACDYRRQRRVFDLKDALPAKLFASDPRWIVSIEGSRLACTETRPRSPRPAVAPTVSQASWEQHNAGQRLQCRS
ncbi:Hypothetical protein SMAX5B_018403 [Scophthalmus maximus]|uniref:Uncharacterized protein n=1 Tax=Scophthalmus maximus TaxID=52904 RepID=A0A2U9CA48_SCOMX|nr:Hypothetical protein SMAX5B_018403 [Scophthalmus maximus]